MLAKKKDSAEKGIRDIGRATRRRYSAEEKTRVVLKALRQHGGKDVSDTLELALEASGLESVNVKGATGKLLPAR